MDKTEKERRGYEAQRLMQEPLLNEAFDKIEQEAVDEMLALPFWSDKKRRMLVDRIKVIRDFRSHLTSVITSGSTNRKTFV
jgi:hypothetical protein